MNTTGTQHHCIVIVGGGTAGISVGVRMCPRPVMTPIR